MVLPDICQNRLYRSLVLLQKECVEQYAAIYWGVAAVAIILTFTDKCCKIHLFAEMAELADAHGSGPCDGNIMRVQVPSSALNGAKLNPVYFFKKVFAVVVNFTRK